MRQRRLRATLNRVGQQFLMLALFFLKKRRAFLLDGFGLLVLEPDLNFNLETFNF